MSRIWDLPCSELDDVGLLAEHRELHGVWTVIVCGKAGYSRHPETLRWRGHLKALYARHEEQVREMATRGWPAGICHKTPLDPAPLEDCDDGSGPALLLSLAEQRALIEKKRRERRRGIRQKGPS
jgi:hypothetical protein